MGGKKIGVYCWTGWDRATPTAKKMAAAGFTNVYDLGGLQFMDGMVVEKGAWNGVYPTCAVGDEGDEKNSSAMCWLYIAGVLIAMVVVAALTFIGLRACLKQPV